MSAFPRTLIQIHYHDRPCGVMRVMRAYGATFRIVNTTGESRLICSHDQESHYPEFPSGSILHLPEADYRDFSSKKTFYTTKDFLIESLSEFLLSARTKKPAVVVAHNLTLCKNAALVSAFAGLSRSPRLLNSGCRFFSVVHDLAEEGRVGQLESILRLDRMGVPIRKEIRMIGGAVRHVAVNKKVFHLFKSAGLPVSFLGNPVIMEKAGGPKCLRRLKNHCKTNALSFDPSFPVYAYPARTIARKNPWEAVLLACVLLKGNLLLGPAGGTRNDRRVHDSIRKCARKYNLPVITDIQRILGNRGALDIIPAIYRMSNAVVTTSIAEGFGYLLFEPFLYGKPVLGRRPSEFRYPRSIIHPLLYDRLPVPAGWTPKSSNSKLPASGLIDFALLDDAAQTALVNTLLSSPAMLAEWESLLEKKHAGWPGLPVFRATCSAACIARNKVIIQKQFSMERFSREFKKCFSVIPTCNPQRINDSLFSQSFRDPRTFRHR